MKTAEEKPAKPKKHTPSDGPKVKSGDDGARKLAAVVLEVLGGVLRPSQAAQSLEISVARYYQLELRALEGLVKACAPPLMGPKANPQKEIARLERQLQRLQADCMRYQSLARAAGRAVGLTVSQEDREKTKNGKPRRKPAVRALKVAQGLRGTVAEASAKGVE